MRRTAVALASLAIGLCAVEAWATNGMRMIGFGPVQNAMGGASAGIPLDAATTLTNPAGMTEHGARIDFGASYFSPSVKYSATEIQLPPGFGGLIVGQNGVELDSTMRASPIPALGLIVPLGKKARVGIGAYGVAGMGVNYPQNLYGGISATGYSQMRFAPAFAYKVNDKFSFGVTVNIMYGQMSYDVASAFGQAAHIGGSAFGIGATVGILYKPLKMLTIGLAYETQSVFQRFDFNVGARMAPNPMDPANPIPLPAGVDSLDFDQPQTVTLGFGVHPLKGLTLGLDVQYINWSGTNGLNQPAWADPGPDGFSSKQGAMAWNLHWKDQVVIKFGLQYQINKTLAVRAGYNWGEKPVKPERAFENIVFPAVAEHHLTFGLGLNLTRKLFINMGGMYAPEATITGANAGNPLAREGQGIASYTSKMSQFSVDFGIGYKF